MIYGTTYEYQCFGASQSPGPAVLWDMLRQKMVFTYTSIMLYSVDMHISKKVFTMQLITSRLFVRLHDVPSPSSTTQIPLYY